MNREGNVSEERSENVVRVERGNPDSAELAALVAVLGRLGSADRECEFPERARSTAPWVAADKGAEFVVPRSWKRQRN